MVTTESELNTRLTMKCYRLPTPKSRSYPKPTSKRKLKKRSKTSARGVTKVSQLADTFTTRYAASGSRIETWG